MPPPKLQISHEIREEFLHSEEGNIFVLGSCMLILWIEAMALLWRIAYPGWLNILTVGLTHVVAGRAASIAHGTHAGLAPGLIAFLAVYADTTAMFLLYPLFVFSYRNYFEGRFFQKHMKPFLESAQRGAGSLHGSKIVGVFLFVWFPFWMTGIIIGSVLGHLLGLRTWVTMATVITGATAAVVSWVYAYDKLFGWLADINQAIPIVLTICIFTGVVVYRFTRKRRLSRPDMRDSR